MNPTKITAFKEISQWIKYKNFTKEDLAQILCAVDKECLKSRGITISEILSKGAKWEKTQIKHNLRYILEYGEEIVGEELR